MNTNEKQSLEYLCSYFTKLIKQADYKHIFHRNTFSDLDDYLEDIDLKIMKGITISNKIKSIIRSNNMEIWQNLIDTRMFVIRTTTNMQKVLSLWHAYNKQYKKGTFLIHVPLLTNIQDEIPLIHFMQQILKIINSISNSLNEPIDRQAIACFQKKIHLAAVAYSNLSMFGITPVQDIRFIPGIIRQAVKYMNIIYRYWIQLDYQLEDSIRKYGYTVNFEGTDE